MGLHPILGVGCHTRLADGTFALLMKELGIDPPESDNPNEEIKVDWFKRNPDFKEIKGRSSLHKWTCPVCGLNARMGIKTDPKIRHEPFEQKTGHAVFFIQEDGLKHTIYKEEDSN